MKRHSDEGMMIIGSSEIVNLPELGLSNITTRIDTGAKTSALHVDQIQDADDEGVISFEFHPEVHNINKVVKCSAQLHDIRWVRSSNGERENRYVILTPVVMGGTKWEIEVTLTDRSEMTHMMLLGREAMKNGILVNPGKSLLVSKRQKNNNLSS